MADTVSEAQAWYRENLDALSDQREQIREDLEFSDPSNPRQWDPEEERQRLNDPGGARPCLVMDQTGQYVANVAGQVEQRPPAMHAIPVDGGADRKVADQLDGFFRHIEHASRASQHYARAETSAARTGVGYIIVRPEVVDRALNYQEPRISSEGDPLRVVLDAFSQALDGSDADCGWLLTPMSHKAFERQFGAKAEKVSFGQDETRQATEREEIVVAEQWIVENDTKTMVVFLDAEGNEAALTEDDFKAAIKRGEPLQFQREYKEKYRCVKWCRMSGAEILTEETVYPASGIGIVPVYGYVGWANGRMTYCGIPRRAREPQKAYNYHVSEIRAIQSLAAKAPYLMPLSGIGDANIQALWDKASVQSRAYLPYQDWDAVNGRPITPPTRAQVSVNLSNHEAGAAQAIRDIQAAIGMYQANLGAPSNETSGVAIESRKQQGEASTANFPSNLGASLTHAAKLTLEIGARVIDTKRMIRILGSDLAPSTIYVDPKQGEAVRELPQGGLSINPSVGRYDFRVVIGPSFATQRNQTAEMLNEIMARNPALAPAIAIEWADNIDVKDGPKLKEAISMLAPPEVRAVYKTEENQESVGALKAQIEQLTGKLQQAAQIAQEAQQEADEANQQLDAAKADTSAKVADSEAKQDEVSIKAYDAYTKRLDTLIKALGPQAGAVAALGALPPEMPPDLRQMLVETINQASMQPAPAEEPQEVAMEPEEPQGPAPEMLQLLEGQQALTEGLGQISQAMGQLIKLVQAKRIRTPERGQDGSITRVVDSIELEDMAAQGPMQ